jgi:hypothetical protein
MSDSKRALRGLIALIVIFALLATLGYCTAVYAGMQAANIQTQHLAATCAAQYPGISGERMSDCQKFLPLKETVEAPAQ